MKDKNLNIFLKRLRLESGDQSMGVMADALGISLSYLSAIEKGKRNMPDDLMQKIITLYSLNQEQQKDLKYLRDLSSSKLNVSFDEMDPEKKSTTVKFLSNVDQLSESDLEKINSILNKKK